MVVFCGCGTDVFVWGVVLMLGHWLWLSVSEFYGLFWYIVRLCAVFCFVGVCLWVGLLCWGVGFVSILMVFLVFMF